MATKTAGSAGVNTKASNPNEELCCALLRAESEAEVTEILEAGGMLKNEDDWKPLGDTENNWSAAGNQQSAAAGALVEKMINGIDAVLIYECLKRGIDPTSAKAPTSMADAAKKFFDVPSGRLENVPSHDRTGLAERVQLVAVGSKEQPNYLVIDKGEGQAPADFSETFLSLAKSNKLHIHFVQGKYNAGGTGALRFCGRENYQLIVSRRAPNLPVKKPGNTSAEWGFTLIRRLRPSEGTSRRNSMYVYYAPGGDVPSFPAKALHVVPGSGAVGKPPTPY